MTLNDFKCKRLRSTFGAKETFLSHLVREFVVVSLRVFEHFGTGYVRKFLIYRSVTVQLVFSISQFKFVLLAAFKAEKFNFGLNVSLKNMA